MSLVCLGVLRSKAQRRRGTPVGRVEPAMARFPSGVETSTHGTPKDWFRGCMVCARACWGWGGGWTSPGTPQSLPRGHANKAVDGVATENLANRGKQSHFRALPKLCDGALFDWTARRSGARKGGLRGGRWLERHLWGRRAWGGSAARKGLAQTRLRRRVTIGANGDATAFRPGTTNHFVKATPRDKHSGTKQDTGLE